MVQPFELLEPRSLEEALDLLAADPDARPLAGGTAMVLMLKQGILRPERLINLKKIGGATGISSEEDGGIRIGALTSIGEVERDARVRASYPGLADTCHVVANVRIRNLATLGGNLAHADYQSDPPAMLTALDARVRIRSAEGDREVPIAQFLVSGYETTLNPVELVTEIVIPPLGRTYRMQYVKFTTRSAEDRPCAGIAVLLAMDGGRCMDLRLVIGAVSSTPVLVFDAKSLAVGNVMTEDLASEIGARAAASVQPVDDIRGSGDYKRSLVGVLTRRALLQVASQAAV
jgi:carbon-monoxide dehydrogenase medium subunit